MKYRSRQEIVNEILASARELQGVTKTRIMYKAYLSTSQLSDYLTLLLSRGLLAYDPTNNKYRTTDKGLQMLATWSVAKSLLDGAPRL